MPVHVYIYIIYPKGPGTPPVFGYDTLLHAASSWSPIYGVRPEQLSSALYFWPAWYFYHVAIMYVYVVVLIFYGADFVVAWKAYYGGGVLISRRKRHSSKQHTKSY